MDVSEVNAYPSEDSLKAILNTESLDIVSPFLSGWSLSKIKKNKHDKVRIITRLPVQYHAPTAYLDNDPSPIKAAMDRMGDQLKIYALPTVHAKLYINDASSWAGSANFTRNGFSGKQEILMRFDGNNARWMKIYKGYQADARLVKMPEIEKLIKWCDLGLSQMRQKAVNDEASPDQPVQIAASFDDFVNWLAEPSKPKKPIRKHISDRVAGKNYMSGHVYPAFNGILAYLRMNPDKASKLVSLNDTEIPTAILDHVAAFIKKYGDEYRGTQGGYWRRYLSDTLGGTQTAGGAGNTIVKKCLVLLPIYMRDRGLI